MAIHANLHGNPRTMLSVSYASLTVFKTRGDLSEEEMAERYGKENGKT